MSESGIEIRVPDIGEADNVEVVEILVAVGQQVAVDDAVVVLESDKASMEVPATHAGQVASIAVKPGDAVVQGDVLLVLAADGAGEAAASAAAGPDAEPAVADAAAAVVSDGAAADDGESVVDPAVEAAVEAMVEPVIGATVGSAVAGGDESVASAAGTDVHAGPAVRKQARQYGVDLAAVRGSGPHGRVLHDDVMAFVRDRLRQESGGGGARSVPLPDFSRFGETETVPMSRIRQASARNLQRSWQVVPHVTQFDEADVTELEAFRRAENERLRGDGVRLTPLPFLIAAVVRSLQAFPRFNSSLSEEADAWIVKKYYNIGVAVDTDDGLVVPVVKGAERLGLVELAACCAELAEQARRRKLPLDAMQGAGFTISSLGGIGGTAFTPIVNAPEVAILGVSRAQVRPQWRDDGFVPRTLLPLCLSYDHRAIDGAEAARFLSHLALLLGDVRRLLL